MTKNTRTTKDKAISKYLILRQHMTENSKSQENKLVENSKTREGKVIWNVTHSVTPTNA